ncbi:MAG: hypothetical protein JNL55_31125 [Steroidobacter sp.]|nr:hypothetical protein [Steroidobacter sp.]
MATRKRKTTRLALAAQALGEAVPKTRAAVAKLAKQGAALLKKYRPSKKRKVAAAKQAPAKKAPAKKTKKTSVRSKSAKNTTRPAKPR